MSSPVTTPPVGLSIKGFRRSVENNEEEFDIENYREIIQGSEIQKEFPFDKILWDESYPEKPLFIVLNGDTKYAIKLGLDNHYRGSESKFNEVKKEDFIYDRLQNLKTDNFVKKIQSGMINRSCYYLIIEYIEGLDLEEYYQEVKYSLRDVFQILLNLANALDILLSINRIHGDIAFENIAINPKTLKIKLLDFGSSSIIKSQQNVKKVTKDILGEDIFDSRPLPDTGTGFIFIFAKLLEKIGKLDEFMGLIRKIRLFTDKCYNTDCKDIYKEIHDTIHVNIPKQGGRKTRKSRPLKKTRSLKRK
jgi:serine/threonine protein kinase